ncbi:response regulator transcription factor [Actinomadura barringtoniae]|uniref:Response regulator transcription factor n=1 Tax=Actinomadura barringtoniae TaxID=1427535 RepID=A0A939T433_9ACTN|nr:response regulator transcription factor [Actinomadura barringtoniae]MBO2448988.1 response regulator transcription factor [Actinomadura barringtoniae]
MIRVLLADDQPVMRAGLAMLLDAEPDIEVVGQVGDGAAAVEAARLLGPQVVVMDVRMPGMDGVEATRAIVADAARAGVASRAGVADGPDPPVRVLILTTYDADDLVIDALRSGAAGFLLKFTGPAELVLAVRAVAAGHGWLDPVVTGRLVRELTTRSQPASVPPERLRGLTPRELQILKEVARGLSNAEIAARLVISEATVKTHFTRVLMKLGLRDRAQAVASAYQSGLVESGG